jgi:chromosome segregation ATPase|tara:strand:- start:10727 stop:11143 length:417 start_codon:yes stop_codon:yes gene_type:complete
MTDQNQSQLNKLQSEVSDIKTTVETNRLLVDRLDRAIEKMTEVSGHISKLLAVHETRIENQDESISITHKRISELRDDLNHTMERNYDSIVAEFKVVRLMFEKHEKRIIMLEKWKYGVIASAAAIGFLMSKVDISAIF